MSWLTLGIATKVSTIILVFPAELRAWWKFNITPVSRNIGSFSVLLTCSNCATMFHLLLIEPCKKYLTFTTRSFIDTGCRCIIKWSQSRILVSALRFTTFSISQLLGISPKIVHIHNWAQKCNMVLKPSTFLWRIYIPQ